MDYSEIECILAGKSTNNTKVDKLFVTEDESFIPVIRRNVTYVVAAVLFNDKGEVLLTQEGFHPHMGHWYLPAGRVDPKETLREAAKREVREETGVEFEPTSMIAVESPGTGDWYRFTFTGHVTGGRLRTLEEKDSETLQGGYWPVDKVMCAKHSKADPNKYFVLRGTDILKLINCGVKYHTSNQAPHLPILPCDMPHTHLLIRPLILCSTKSEGGEEELNVLMVKREDSQSKKLPLLQFDPHSTSAVMSIVLFTEITIGDGPHKSQICGLLGIEHDGTKSRAQEKGTFHDGLLLTVLVKVTGTNQIPPIRTISCQKANISCEWDSLHSNKELEKTLLTHWSTEGVPFMYRH